MKPAIDWWDINIAVSRILGISETGVHLYDSDGNRHYEGEEREYIEDRSRTALFNELNIASLDGHIEKKPNSKTLYFSRDSLVKWLLDNPECYHFISDKFLEDCCSLYFIKNKIFLKKINVIRKERANSVRTDESIFNTKTNTTINKTAKIKAENSLLKILVGMAIDGYQYNPRLPKTDFYKKLADDLDDISDKNGYDLRVHEDTVRKWFHDAKEALDLNKPKENKSKPNSV